MKTPYMFSKFDERLIILTNCVHGTWHVYRAAVSLHLPRVAVCLVGWITMPETNIIALQKSLDYNECISA